MFNVSGRLDAHLPNHCLAVSMPIHWRTIYSFYELFPIHKHVWIISELQWNMSTYLGVQLRLHMATNQL